MALRKLNIGHTQWVLNTKNHTPFFVNYGTVLSRQKFLNCPNVVSQTRRHRGSFLKSHVQSAKVVPERVKAYRRSMVLNFLAVSVGQAGVTA